MQMLKRCAQIGAVSLLFSCGLAMAQLTTGPYTSTTVTTELDYFGGAAVGTPFSSMEYLAFPLFDPSMGAITGINLSVTFSLGTNNDSASIVGNSPSAGFSGDGSTSQFEIYGATETGDVTETASVQIYLLDSGGVYLPYPATTSCLSGITVAGDEASASCLLGTLPTLNFTNTDDGVTSAVSLLDPINDPVTGSVTNSSIADPNFSEFYGAGTVYLPLYVEAQTSAVTDNGNIDSAVTLNGGVTATLTYTYDLSTPEPASMVLMGLALTAIGVVRRRKSRG